MELIILLSFPNSQNPDLRTNMLFHPFVKVTHLSRSDSDKMLSDMAEGSADYSDSEDPYDDSYDGDDMSGSGDDNITSKLFNSPINLKEDFTSISYADNPDVKIVEDGTPHEIPRDRSPDQGSSGNSLRISLMSATLVVSSLIVISLKQF